MTVWLSRPLILAIHEEQIAAHGGAPGLRDAGLLDSALAQPLNRAGYTDPDVAELAAVYALAIAHNHPFIDGNKRTAYVALETFLALNGLRFPVTDADAVITTLRMAAGDLADADFIAWVARPCGDAARLSAPTPPPPAPAAGAARRAAAPRHRRPSPPQ